MATYEYKVYDEREHLGDRYRMDVYVYDRGKVTASNRNHAIEKVLLKVGMMPRGNTLDIRTEKGSLSARLYWGQRPVEPWGWQWSEGTISYKSDVRNYVIHNGHVYYVMGAGMVANRLNPPKRK